MIAHIAEFEGPADVLEGIGMQGFRDRVVPVLEAQPGFEGRGSARSVFRAGDQRLRV